ncbi:carbohydrate esterase family 12 protein [Pleomassaria siparia CBS 279.74]|uniref:Carbohydrate esterase family 12 protein n=1 Tax=Pleomassaria siparia CBS 279.74 TaxID=1314801 RepID=A0A6G1KCV4_9PLEO|nr:carbohydrate esterase family 12 protein [Pleomassaria siparia CBS 279.74]
MRTTLFNSVLLVAGLVGAATAIPTVWVTGDSTTSIDGGKNGTQGWAQYLKYSFGSNALVNNSARAGRSSRSFTRDGRFDQIGALMKSGDWVVIEFGINDAGIPQNGSTKTTGDYLRAVCPGAGNETCTVVYGTNITEVVQTYPTYVKAASQKFLDLGAAGVIISERLPTNVWESGSYSYTPTIYSYYNQLLTTELGGPSSHVYYVQHGSYAAQAQKLLGADIVNANYPMDHTHSSPFLADVHSQAFVLGLKCGTSPLGNLIVNATARIETALGPCLTANATIPI